MFHFKRNPQHEVYRIGPKFMWKKFCAHFYCFGENSRWRKIYHGANGRGLYGEMRLDPRNPGKKEFSFSDLRFKSYGPKRKVGRYSATMRPSVVIIFRFIRKIIMYVLSEVWNCSPYGLREKNTWLWFSVFHIKPQYELNY